jgi:hypothetical protein
MDHRTPDRSIRDRIERFEDPRFMLRDYQLTRTGDKAGNDD